MDFISNLTGTKTKTGTGTGTETGTDHPEKKQLHHPQPSSSELLSSAKLVAEAAQATLGKESDKVDKARVAAAAEDLLNAASHYGNLEEKGMGQYVQKAENYLHQYHSSHSSTTSTTAPAGAGSTTEHSSSHAGGDDKKSGGGSGDYFKMAEGFLKKH